MILGREAVPAHGRTAAEDPLVEVRSSARRKKTATAFYEGDRVVVVVPLRLSRRERDEVVQRLVRRVVARRNKTPASDEVLLARALELSEAYLDGRRPTSVRYVTNQRRRFGSCTPATGEIRISSLLRGVPGYVLDAILVHELAHLSVVGHGPEFRELEQAYPRAGDARLFLAGFSYGLDASPGLTEPERRGRGELGESETGLHSRAGLCDAPEIY
jgi:predicted metal-dependent hydrolase